MFCLTLCFCHCVCIGIQICTKRDSIFLAGVCVGIPISIVLVSLILSISASHNREINSRFFHLIPVNFPLVFTYIYPITNCSWNVCRPCGILNIPCFGSDWFTIRKTETVCQVMLFRILQILLFLFRILRLALLRLRYDIFTGCFLTGAFIFRLHTLCLLIRILVLLLRLRLF